MKYTMKVKLTDPKTAEGMMSELFFTMDWEFAYNEDDYGNGHHALVKSEAFPTTAYDLRYDNTFHRNKKEEWLVSWAKNYWNGKNGAWAVKSVEVTKA